MNTKCVLKTEGYLVTFELKQLRIPDMDVETDIEFTIDPRLSNIALRRDAAWLFAKDLERLLAYFEEHISLLAENPSSISGVFVNMDLDFTIQAYQGEVRSGNDGEFSLQFMLNIGRAEEGNAQTYIGGDSVVALTQVKDFILSMRVGLAELRAGLKMPATGS